jgi:osmotically-inducible protein OsmY
MCNRIILATPTDQLETLIKRLLLGRAALRRIRVVVHEQGLVLQGCAATYYAKQLAQHAAMEVTGLPLLANEIEVR